MGRMVGDIFPVRHLVDAMRESSWGTRIPARGSSSIWV